MAIVNHSCLAPKPPDPSPLEDGAPSKSVANVNHRNSVNLSHASYAKIVAGVSTPTEPPQRPPLMPRFPPLSLPLRQVSSKDGRPAISFTGVEIGACVKRFEFSLVAKFTVGRPSIMEIKDTLKSAWNVTGRVTLSEIWDSRHLLVILDSEADVRVALASSVHKVGHAMFRLFRWTPDYNPKAESRLASIWVRLPGLPLTLYDSAFVEAIVSTFGYFVAVDDRTKACIALKYARACVELDVTRPIPDAVWISLPEDKGYWQKIVPESNHAYCSKCRVHGHTLDTCRKASRRQGSFPPDNKNWNAPVVNAEAAKKGNQVKDKREEWVQVKSKKGNKKEVIPGEISSTQVDDTVAVSQQPSVDPLAMVVITGELARQSCPQTL